MSEHAAEKGLPVLCDERGDRCCGTPACSNAGLWKDDPYDESIGVFEGRRWHMHSEPACADPNCVTYLTRSQMATMRARTRVFPPGEIRRCVDCSVDFATPDESHADHASYKRGAK